MPAGPLPLGLAYFAAVKLAGYSAAGWALNRAEPARPRAPLAFGLARTAIGIVAGAALGALLLFGTDRPMAFYAALLPVRMIEWGLAIALFYPALRARPGRLLLLALLGSVWSYVLDLPAVFAVFTLPGGMWIC